MTEDELNSTHREKVILTHQCTKYVFLAVPRIGQQMAVKASKMAHLWPLASSVCGFYLGCSRRCWALRACVHCLCRDRKDRAGPEALVSSHTSRCCRRDDDCENIKTCRLFSGKLNCTDAAVKSGLFQCQHLDQLGGPNKCEKKHNCDHVYFFFIFFIFLMHQLCIPFYFRFQNISKEPAV